MRVGRAGEEEGSGGRERGREKGRERRGGRVGEGEGESLVYRG